MPAEEDYGQRRQLLLQHASGGTSSPLPLGGSAPAERHYSPAPSAGPSCPAGCPATDRLQERASQERLQAAPGGPPEPRPNPAERLYASAPPKETTGERSHHGTLDRHHDRDRERDRYHAQSSTERLIRYTQPDRFTPVPNINSLDRYGSLGTNLSATDRYQNVHADGSSSSNRSLDRYSTGQERFSKEQLSTERFSNPDNQVYQRVTTPQTNTYTDRYSGRYQQDRFQNNERYNCERYNTSDRFTPQNSERSFSSQERIPYTQVPYIPPPSPAPASDRFIPPPPLSPTNTPSPDCYPSNPFPSPTTTVPTERFIPPPPLSPSPTEKFSPKPDRFRYSLSPNPEKYHQYHQTEPRYQQDRYQCYPDRYAPQGYHVTDRYGNTTERYLPPNAHTPVERYVPQPQEPYYQTYQSYERYPKFHANTNAGDPYMRRDLGYHHHYRLPVPFQANHYQRIRYSHIGTPNRAKCCQYQDFTLSKSSPGSSSSSSVTSQGKEIQGYIANPVKDIQCYHGGEMIPQQIQCVNYQGKDMQCVGFGQQTVRPKAPCKHVCSSPGVEYVGQAGGRVVCATPPPPRPASGGPETQCGEQCCQRRPQSTAVLTTTTTAAIW